MTCPHEFLTVGCRQSFSTVGFTELDQMGLTPCVGMGEALNHPTLTLRNSLKSDIWYPLQDVNKFLEWTGETL